LISLNETLLTCMHLYAIARIHPHLGLLARSGVTASAVMDEQNILRGAYIPFAHAEPSGKLFFISRQAHQDGDLGAVEDDGQRFFEHDMISDVLGLVGPHTPYRPAQTGSQCVRFAARDFFARNALLCYTAIPLEVLSTMATDLYQNHISGVAGIVLAGGTSSRLGQDKAFVDARGLTLVERVVEQLRQAVDEIILVTDRPAEFSFLGLPTTSDLYPGVGVLGGLHAGLSAARSDHVLAVGCDMPFLCPDLLRYLLSLRTEADVVMPRIDGYHEPLHAVYSRACLPNLERTIRAKRRRILHALDGLRIRYVERVEMEPYDPELRSFFNVNKPEDLARLEELLSDD